MRFALPAFWLRVWPDAEATWQASATVPPAGRLITAESGIIAE
jgi:hypothetical protein